MLTRPNLLTAYIKKDWNDSFTTFCEKRGKQSGDPVDLYEIEFDEKIRESHNIHPPILYDSFDDIVDYLYSLERQTLVDFVFFVEIKWGDFSEGSDEKAKQDDKESVVKARKLVALFPEVYWVFVVKEVDRKELDNIPPLISKYHFIRREDITEKFEFSHLEYTKNGFRTLFDPTGFREWLRSGKEVKPQALSIEDEFDSCVFNAYILYKQGMNVFIAPTKAEFSRFNTEEKKETIEYCIEDIQLNYPDLESKKSYEVNSYIIPSLKEECLGSVADLLYERNIEFKIFFKSIQNRIILTATHSVKKGTLFKEFKELDKLIESGRLGEFGKKREKEETNDKLEVIYKPSKGIYAPVLSYVLNLENDEDKDNGEKRHGGHGTKGHRQVIAKSLIDASRRILSNSKESLGVIGAIQLAVLASEASEWLENTPDMKFTAIGLKHLGEVIAECNFSGVAIDVDITDKRIKKIEQEISKQDQDDSRKEDNFMGERQQKNAYISILDSIQQTLLKYGKFDEANRCTRVVYKEHVELRFLDKKIKKSEGGGRNSNFLCKLMIFMLWVQNTRLYCWLEREISLYLSKLLQYGQRIVKWVQNTRLYCWLERLISLYLGKLLQDGQQLVWYSIGWVLFFAFAYTFIPGNDLYSGAVQNCEPLAQGILLEFFNHLYISLMLFISFGFPGGIIFCDNAEYIGLIRFLYVLNVSMGVIHVSVYIAYLYSILLRR